MARVVVIVLLWKSAGRIEGCLDSLRQQTFTDFELVIVDNASVDGSPDTVRERWPAATILRQATNTGFTGGVNRGLRHMFKGSAAFAWLLNDDTEFGPDVLGALVARADAVDRPGLVSPYLQDADGSIAFGMDDPYPQSRRRGGPITPDTTMLMPGTALLVRREVFERVGLLDPRYFLYREDDDLCLRADRAGFVGVYCAEAVVRHAFDATDDSRGPGSIYFRLRNKLLFRRSHSAVVDWPRYCLRTVSAGIRQANRHRGRGEGRFVDAALAGVWDGLLGRTGGPFDPSRRMPAALSRLLMSRSAFLGELLRGRGRAAFRRAVRSGRARSGRGR